MGDGHEHEFTELDLDTVLVADDNNVDRMIIEAVVREAGYNCVSAKDGVEAWELIQSRLPAVAVLDVMMPGLGGFEVCERVKADKRTCDISVIFISVKSMLEDKLKGLNIGAVDFINKPFFKREILARLKTHMRLRNAWQRLLESEKNYTTLVDNISYGIFLWNDTEGISFVNPSFCAILGYREDELLGLPLPAITHADEPLDVAAAFKETLRTGERTAKEHCLMLRRKGGAPVYVNCVPERVYLGKSPALLVTANDISERLALERQLLQSQKMEAVGRLASGIAHDFNNLLALINGFSELALGEIGENERLKEYLDIVLEAGQNAVSLTRGLLTFTRKGSLEQELVDLRQELKGTVAFLSRGLSKRIALKLKMTTKAVNILADRNQLQQMLVNLCVNARDAMPKGGTIQIILDKVDSENVDVKLPQPGAFAKITVADDGDGIPPGIIDKIFDPFFTTKAPEKGSGLGLAMVNRMVNNHNGCVTVKSEPGKGSSFDVYLPASQQKVEPFAKIKHYEHQTRKELNKVLVIDDDLIQVEMIKHFLWKQGYEVLTAASAAEGFKLTEANPGEINLFIVDYLMPKTSGFEFCSKVNERWPGKKIIVISGATQIPPSGYFLLRKPFTMRDLFIAIDKVAMRRTP